MQPSKHWLAAWMLAGLGLCLGLSAQASQPAISVTAQGAADASAASSTAVKTPATKALGWKELTADQRMALAPLADEWHRISEAQRRKWIAVTRQYKTLSQQDQATLQGRMKEWVAMSPKDRAEARLNFAEAKKLSPEDRKAKWDAYQALTQQEREKLAATAPRTVKGAAPALRPAASERLARVPAAEADQPKPPRIAASPQLVDHNTLLPQQPAQ
ncbi:MAG: DUF3106 domain-containing protein [Betaproteobacteria bacterium]|nr:DUF3106 domain-containing protein [Betaproteobacteria bacterium]